MSYKDKAGEYRGGALTEQQPKVVLRYPCFADNCPMPGTIFPGAVQGETGDQKGTCAWHYGVKPHDIPRITQALRDWGCVSAEVNAARRLLTGEHGMDPKAMRQARDLAWDRMRPLVRDWADELQPTEGEGYSDWAKRLNVFLGRRLNEVMAPAQRRAA